MISKAIKPNRIVFFIIFVILSAAICELASSNQIETENTEIFSDISVEIIISNDQDFIDMGFDGNGTEVDPYLIENLTINSETECIAVSSTTKHFTIRNCNLESFATTMEISDIISGTIRIENNIINSSSRFGLNVFNCEEAEVDGNTLESGISFDETYNSSITNNELEKTGISISANTEEEYNTIFMQNNTIASKEIICYTDVQDITITNTNIGQMFLISCQNISIQNQIIFDVDNGLQIFYSREIEVNSSYFGNNWENGLEFHDSEDLSVKNCTFDYNTNTGLRVWISDDVFLYNNTFIENRNLGLSVESSSGVNIINSSFINNKYAGIMFRYVNYLTVENNQFINDGIRMSTVYPHLYQNYQFSNNWVNGKILGVFINIDNSVYDVDIYGQLIVLGCDGITFLKLNLERVYQGAFIYNSEQIELNNCTMKYCNYDGISVDRSDNIRIKNCSIFENNGHGIILSRMNEYGKIIDNEIFNNGYDGIFLDETSYYTIKRNIIMNHQYNEAIVVWGNHNSIHHNTIVGNGRNGNQAADYGSYNIWYDVDKLEGNHWSDWIGYGWYEISGFSSSQDIYPMVIDPGIDSDNDGMADNWEILVGLNANLNDSHEDIDDDELLNKDEYFAKTNPHDEDSDDDQMPDGWEVIYGINPLISNAQADPDEDGLTNLEEYNIGTNPLNADTDGDGVSDGEEVENGTDPTVNETKTTSFNLLFSIFAVIVSKVIHIKYSKKKREMF